jgi:hypothetical protein
MGHQGAIRVFDINREGDGTKRALFVQLSFSHLLNIFRQSLPNRHICSTLLDPRLLSAHLHTHPGLSSLGTNLEKSHCSM